MPWTVARLTSVRPDVPGAVRAGNRGEFTRFLQCRAESQTADKVLERCGSSPGYFALETAEGNYDTGADGQECNAHRKQLGGYAHE
jgi:hypothetical protein